MRVVTVLLLLFSGAVLSLLNMARIEDARRNACAERCGDRYPAVVDGQCYCRSDLPW